MATHTKLKRPLRVFFPLKGSRKSDDVYEQISELVRKGHFPVGNKLPSERDLAAHLNTSRQTIREALYRAELVGLIEVRHGTGSFVVSATPRKFADTSLFDLITLQTDRIAEFFEMRRLLEGWCVAQAARVATAADLNLLRQKLARMRELELTDPEWEPNDVEFHVAIAKATRNPMAVRVIEILREGFSQLYKLKSVVHNKEDKELVCKHHWAIFDAIRKHSPEAARRAIVAHMDYVESELKNSVEDIDESAGSRERRAK